MSVPKFYLESSYRVTILKNDYNLRFSPDTIKSQNAQPGGTYDAKTNILAKLPANTSVKVLSEIIENEDRTWLYVEVLNKDINKKKNRVELFNDRQNIEAG